jgi:DNA-binding NarL/FixJ family response regulator
MTWVMTCLTATMAERLASAALLVLFRQRCWHVRCSVGDMSLSFQSRSQVPAADVAAKGNSEITKQTRSLIVASRDALLIERLERAADSHQVVLHVSSASDVVTVLRQQACPAGVLIDLEYRGGEALQQLHALRGADPLVSALVLAERPLAALVNGLHALRVEVLVKPLPHDAIDSFLARSLARGWLSDRHVATWIDTQARQLELTTREAQLIHYALGKESKRQVLSRLAISENTMKVQLRRLLRKCGTRTLDGLAVHALGQSLTTGLQAAD